MKAKTLRLSAEEFESLNEEFAGVCRGCGALDECAGIEPDGWGGKCPACGLHKVIGLEDGLICGIVEVAAD